MKIKLTISRDALKAKEYGTCAITKTGILPEERSTESLSEMLKAVKRM